MAAPVLSPRQQHQHDRGGQETAVAGHSGQHQTKAPRARALAAAIEPYEQERPKRPAVVEQPSEPQVAKERSVVQACRWAGMNPSLFGRSGEPDARDAERIGSVAPKSVWTRGHGTSGLPCDLMQPGRRKAAPGRGGSKSVPGRPAKRGPSGACHMTGSRNSFVAASSRSRPSSGTSWRRLGGPAHRRLHAVGVRHFPWQPPLPLADG